MSNLKDLSQVFTGRCGSVEVLLFAQDDRQRKDENLSKEHRDLAAEGI
jgi:hypothetical protein